MGATKPLAAKASTRALASDSPHDATYTRIENRLAELGTARDGLAAQMSRLLLGATLYGHPLNQREARNLIAAGYRLLGEAAVLAA